MVRQTAPRVDSAAPPRERAASIELALRVRRGHRALAERARQVEGWIDRLERGAPAEPALRSLVGLAAFARRTFRGHLAAEASAAAPTDAAEAVQVERCAQCLADAALGCLAGTVDPAEVVRRARHLLNRLRSHLDGEGAPASTGATPCPNDD